MSRDVTLRPPKVVRETAQAALDLDRDHLSVGVDLSKGEPIPLSSVKRMYRFLSENRERYRPDLTKREGEPTDGTVEWSLWGGLPGLQWARRILCQNKMHKVSPKGDLILPGILDLQFGPDIFAGIVRKSCDYVSSVLAEAGIRSACASVDGGTLVLFPGDGPFSYIDDGLGKVYVEESDKTYSLSSGQTVIEGSITNGLLLIDESRSQLVRLAKSTGDSLSGFTCFSVSESESVSGLSVEGLCLLVANDQPEQVAQLLKVDEELGLVFGWAIICKIDGEPYFDTQGDHITESAMLEAVTSFMMDKRTAGDMHVKDRTGEEAVAIDRGTVVFAWPMTTEVAKAFGFEVNQTGLMIAMKPDKELLAKFKDGTYKAFSIGGSRIPEHTEEVR